ncbi:Tubulin-specific chaperone E [Trichinella nativa]|uniref:Leucine-rich repeat-containing protein 51 n=1 Tax=Trichinella nativa TaxID=6335 RepID=A0A0V1LP04_9BILA|nr:Tubulin-specific chaperone E [Trichinella nativa]
MKIICSTANHQVQRYEMLSVLIFFRDFLMDNYMRRNKIPEMVIGCRVRHRGARGVVKFCGRIGSLDGEWLGIEWDEKSRGKHDGTYQNVRYFETSAPQSGSFMRPNTVEYGCSFVEAGKERIIEGTNVSQWEKIESFGSAKADACDKVRKEMSCLCLDGTLVSFAGELSVSDSVLFSGITSLYLRNTLIVDWSEIVKIISFMPRLSSLALSNNKLQSTHCAALENVTFSQIETLALSQTEYNWNEVSVLPKVFPNLNEFWLSYNCIDIIESELKMPSLRLLSLESNPLASWHEVLKLGSLSNLQCLFLGHTKLKEICIPQSGLFPSLRSLMLSHNEISDWNSINELNKIPSLEELSIIGNPVLNLDKSRSRQFVIAKIAHLRVFNKVAISAAERKGSEIDYLKNYGTTWLKLRNAKGMEDNLACFLSEHPRFMDLVKLYGEPDHFETVKNPLKNMTQLLKFTYSDKPAVEKRVPNFLTVQKLKILVGELFHLKPQLVKLSYKSSRNPDIVVSLDHDLYSLSYYSVEENDIIIVEQICSSSLGGELLALPNVYRMFCSPDGIFCYCDFMISRCEEKAIFIENCICIEMSIYLEHCNLHTKSIEQQCCATCKALVLMLLFCVYFVMIMRMLHHPKIPDFFRVK